MTDFPDLTEVQDALADPEPEELKSFTPEEKDVAQKLLPFLTKKANEAAEASYAKKLKAQVDELRSSNETLINQEIEKFREQNRPLTPDDIQKLLTQEYAEFEVRLRERVDKKVTFVTYVICELPQATEQKIVKTIQQKIVPHLKTINAIEFTAGSSVTEKLQKVIDIIPDALDVLAEVCAIALNPYGDNEISVDWVRNNLSSYRIIAIVEAQFLVGKVRDFFSACSRLLPT